LSFSTEELQATIAKTLVNKKLLIFAFIILFYNLRIFNSTRRFLDLLRSLVLGNAG